MHIDYVAEVPAEFADNFMAGMNVLIILPDHVLPMRGDVLLASLGDSTFHARVTHSNHVENQHNFARIEKIT